MTNKPLSPMGSEYSDEQRIEAATQYAILGNMKRVHEAIGKIIPYQTLIDWKNKGDWWDDTVLTVRSERTEQHRARYDEIIELAQDQIVKKLPEATAQQASVVAGIAFDKTRLIDNQPTTIRGDSDTVQALADEFRKLSDEHRNRRVVSVQKGTIEDGG